MRKYKIVLMMIVVILVVITKLSVVNGAEKKIILNNDIMIFTISTNGKSQASLSYLLNGKTYQAAELIPELRNSKVAVYSFKINKFNKKNKSGTMAIFADGLRGSLQFKLDKQLKCLKLFNFRGISRLKVKFKSVALVLPDQISEDIVIYPTTWQQTASRIPGDNHLFLNMLNNGQAILYCIWNSAKIKLTEQKNIKGNSFNSFDLQPKRGDILWLGINAAKNIWCQPTEKLNRKPTRLAWSAPFSATWQVTLKKGISDLHSENNQCDTWILADLDLKQPQTGRYGVYIENQTGKTWASNLGGFSYPFTETQGKVSISYPMYRYDNVGNSYNDNFTPLIYPLKKLSTNGQKNILPYDIMGQVLKPKILNKLHTVRSKNSYYNATCGLTAKIEKIFYRGEDKKSKVIITKYCNEMNSFIFYNRQRMNAYRVWNKKICKRLRVYREQNPASAKLVKSLRKDLAQMDILYAKVREQIKTPQYFQMLTDKIIKLIDSKKNAETKEHDCRQLGRQIRTIGGKQDHLIGMLRSITKAFRIRLTMLLLANSPNIQRTFLEMMRQETTAIMNHRFPMEGK